MQDLIEKIKKAGYQPNHFNMCSIIDNRYNNGKTVLSVEFLKRLEHMKDLRQVTAAIDFECDFNDKTGCRGQYSTERGPKTAICCCKGCADAHGYHYENALVRPGDISYYKERFDPYLGFWRPGKGCILERRMRSNTCVFYNCLVKKVESKENLEKRRALALLEEMARTIDRELRAQIKRGV